MPKQQHGVTVELAEQRIRMQLTKDKQQLNIYTLGHRQPLLLMLCTAADQHKRLCTWGFADVPFAKLRPLAHHLHNFTKLYLMCC